MQKIRALFFVFALSAAPALAQMTVDQRVFDFQVLASLYAKRYAPMEWKRQTANFNGLNIAPWLTRVRAAPDDITYLEIAKEYAASFDDGHTELQAPGSLVAESGLFADIYDGKVLIDGVARSLLPRARFPIEIGDEVISVEGKPVGQALDEISRLNRLGSPSLTRRNAASLLFFRPGASLPRTALLGDSFELQLKQASGEMRTFTIPWVKSGYMPTKIGPVPSPRTQADEPQTEEVDLSRPLWGHRLIAQTPRSIALMQRSRWIAANREFVEGAPLEWGLREPTFALPTGFQTRLGRSAADFHFSGTYLSEGKRIGYLRVPDLSPVSGVAALRELSGEIAFFRQNTDGLVVDMQRNPGGGCYRQMLARYLIPRQFWFPGNEIRVTGEWISIWQDDVEFLRRVRAEQWQIDLTTFQLDLLKQAYADNRSLTGAIPLCTWGFEDEPARDQAGRVVAYEKPLIVLTDNFSASAAETLPAAMQDNGRGKVVGTRTAGLGGTVSFDFNAGFFSEATASNTSSLVVRREPRAIPGYPTTAYIENVGVHPDIVLDRMTEANLRANGRPFQEAFTKIIVEEINKGQ